MQVKGFRWGSLKGNLSRSCGDQCNNRIHFWFSIFLLSLAVSVLSLHQSEDVDDFSDGQRWAGDKDNDVSAGGLDEQWLLPKWGNSTEPTLDVDKKTDYIH